MTSDPEPLAAAAVVRGKTRRLLPDQRRAMLLDRATNFFAENGMAARTRALADACGVAQRLLYRYFPSKAALLQDVYRQAILAPFKPEWLTQLADRALPMEQRLCRFYEDYCETVLSRRWMRLFLFAALDGADMAPDYIRTIVFDMLRIIVEEAAAETRTELPRSPELRYELGWVLHGTISHLAIRQHIYGASRSVPTATVIRLHVATFLSGLAAGAARARASEAMEFPPHT